MSVHEKKLFKTLSDTFAEAGRNGMPPAAEREQSVKRVRQVKHVRRTLKQRISNDSSSHRNIKLIGKGNRPDYRDIHSDRLGKYSVHPRDDRKTSNE